MAERPKTTLEDDSWVPVGMDMPNATYYFSLCPKGQSKCPGNMFFCLKLKDGTILDLGSSYANTSDTVADGNVFYEMSLKGKHGSGVINIQCDPSRMDPVLMTLTQTDIPGEGPFFEYMIKWSSSSNCPLKHFSVRNNCILYTQPRSYDLRPLRRSHQVTVAGKDYVINVCENMNTNCPSYVCEADNGVPPKPLSNAFDLTYLQNKGLSFNYPTLKGKCCTLIH
nr:uncharacterized protein LOC106684739 [Halyomorpha halys]